MSYLLICLLVDSFEDLSKCAFAQDLRLAGNVDSLLITRI